MTSIVDAWIAQAVPQRSIGLTAHERIVLMAHYRFKPSYAGSDRYQMTRAEAAESRTWITGHIPGERFITRAEWATAKTSLTAKGMLTEIGRLTMAGRDAIGGDL